MVARPGQTQRLMLVFGTRPEAIKMAPLVQELRQRPWCEVVAVTTGQHRSMLDQVLRAFRIEPDVDLQLMTKDQSLAGITTAVLDRMSAVLRDWRPDMVLVHGDTTTAMATAMTAFYERIPVAHVEAGLRSFDLSRPWPEEFNRTSIDSTAELLFAPTETSARNLSHEARRGAQIFVTGNTGIDALLRVDEMIETDAELRRSLEERFDFLSPTKRLIVVTGHRRESFGKGFENICNGLASIAERDDVQIVYPVHLSPKVGSVVRARLGTCPSIHLIDPVDYVEFVYLMRRASVLLTDSGGIQEEAPALGRPVLVMRDVTERPEAIASGAAELVGTLPRRLRDAVDRLLDDPAEYARRSRPVFPYGDGTACARIADILQARFAAQHAPPRLIDAPFPVSAVS
jgi:UDP-N-acetylglucosamine 2-epimerase